jgi:branched-chain amino acid transport system substrate-binding protein
MKRNVMTVLVLLFVFLSAVAAVPMSGGVAMAADTIKIGMTSALTGPYSEFGEGNRRAVELAVEKWNKAGGINGKKIEIALLLDDQLVPDRAVQNMRKILDNKEIVGIIGPAGSGPTLAVINMAAADGRPYMNPIAQTPTITYPNGTDKAPRGNVFSFALQNNVETIVLGKYVAKRFKKVGLIHESTAYGVTGVDMIKKELKSISKIDPVAVEAYNQKDQDMTAQVLKLQKAGAEVVVCVGLGADLAVLRRNMARLNYNVPLVASNGALSPPYQDGAKELVIGTKGSMVAVFGQEKLNPAAAEFAKAYKAKYGVEKDRWWGNDPNRPAIFMALSVTNGYDAATILFEGIRRANSTDPKKIISAIESIRNFQGVNAVYSFSPQRHHAIEVDDLAMFEYVKTPTGIKMSIAKD